MSEVLQGFPTQQRWIHRLRELETRLKAEREAKLLNRSGARKKLEEGAEENRRLKSELEKENVRAGGQPVSGVRRVKNRDGGTDVGANGCRDGFFVFVLNVILSCLFKTRRGYWACE